MLISLSNLQKNLDQENLWRNIDKIFSIYGNYRELILNDFKLK